MTVTYKTNSLGITCPVLHKVVYDRNLELPAQYQKSYKDCLVDDWLKENCRYSYYHSPGYLREKSIEFECEQEAVLFALRWS